MLKVLTRQNKPWVTDLQRDVLALGSVVFYFLVIGRALVGPFWDLFVPLMIIAATLVIVNYFSKRFDLYITRGIVLAIFVTRHYGDIIFGVFAAIAMTAMIIASVNLGTSKKKIEQGVLLGLLCGVLMYPLAMLLDS
jgi:hypothetical protein